MANSELPRITLVMPTYNVADYLEAAMDSILSQGYPNLEYILIDGGSNDGTVDIIKKHEKYLTHWVSEKDRGAHHAINKGFAVSTGEIMGWLGGDDFHLPRSLFTIADAFRMSDTVRWITSVVCPVADETGAIVHIARHPGISRASFLDGCHTEGMLPCSTGFLQLESSYWRRDLWNAAGGRLRDELDFAGDFDLWARFFRFADIHCLYQPIAVFRVRSGQNSANQTQYIKEAAASLVALLKEVGHNSTITPPSGYRTYRGTYIINTANGFKGITSQEYRILDMSVQKELKALISGGFIG